MKCLSNGSLQKLIIAICFTVIAGLQALSQGRNVNVSGKVHNDRGEPLQGASITVAGSQAGTTASADGTFTLSVPENGSVTVSAVGYDSKVFKISKATTLDVTLTSSQRELEQVIVVGYGQQRKRDVTGSVVSVSAKTLQEVPAPNVVGQLQGRAAGVDIVSNSAVPGAGGEIRIRGNRSLATSANANNAQNGPLLVVDGIPYSGSINDLNPDDIANIEILKDASATAIYGSRGSNGVILISTRRGRTGKAIMSYNTYYGIINRLGDYRVFNGPEYAAFKEEARLGNSVNPGSSIYGLTNQERANLDAGVSTNWQDLILKQGYKTNQDVSLSGGNETTQYGLGLGYYKETGIIPMQSFDRFTLRSTIDHRINRRVKVGLNTINTLSYSKGNGLNPIGTLVRLSPLTKPYNDDGTINMYPLAGQLDANTVNPLTIVDNEDKIKNLTRRLRTFNSLYAEVEVVKNLKYRLNVGLDFRQDMGSNYLGPNILYNNNPTTAQSSFNQSNGEAWNYIIDNLLTYEKTFAQRHRINFTGLYGIQKDRNQTGTIFGQGIPADFIQDYNFGLANSVSAINPTNNNNPWGFSERGLVSYMGRINYAFDNRYLLTATVRRDGSSVLSRGNQWFTYPAFSLGWNIDNEKFMERFPVISTLKLRGGVGVTSSQSIDPYSTLGTLAINYYNYGSGTTPNVNYMTGFFIPNLANPNLRWESTTATNVGIDFGLLRNRITGTIDVYQQRTKDILMQQNLPRSIGASTTTVNAGKTKGRGLEFSISSMNIQSKSGFSWNTDLNLSVIREEIVQLQDPSLKADIANGWFVGQPLNVIYDVKKIGIWQTADSALARSYGQRPGQIRVEDISGPDGKPDGKITADDRQIVGNFQPRWIGGMTNRVSYKNIDLSIVMFARMGQTVVVPYVTADGGANGYPFFNNSRVNQYKVDYWTPTNPTNKFPRPDASSDRFNYASTLAYRDGSFIKIRSINLGYNLPSTLLSGVGISSLRVYFTAQNPFILYSPFVREGLGLDPEGNGYGGTVSSSAGGSPVQGRAITVNLNAPSTRQFLFGLNARF